jgi:hypothetical protein
VVETRTALIGTRRAVLDYCQEHKINPRDREYILVSHIENLRGYSCKINDVWVGPPLALRMEYEITRYIAMINARYP